ncbi:MAG: hypothetical protein AB1801_25260, partial [Chloroflexota bacterium]
WLDKDLWGGQTQYNNAFVGQPDQTLLDLFLASMELTPARLTYLAEPAWPARSFTIQVESTSTTSTFSWQSDVLSPSSWISVAPLSGKSGEHMTVTVKPTGKIPGVYHTTIKVTANDAQVRNREQLIPIDLYVFERVYSNYLPLLLK